MFKSFEKSELTESDVAEMLSFIPPPVKGTNSRESWLKVIAATCDALKGNEAAALRLLENWNPPWHKNAYESAIKSLHGNYKSTAGTLVFLAKENGYAASAKAKERAARERTPRKEKTETRAENVAENPRKEKTDTTEKPAPAAAFLAPVKLGKCSVCESCRKPANIKETDLIACLRAIKAGKWKNEVAAVRTGTREKSTLPQVCAYGVYSARRADENLMTRSGFLVLDYDGKDNPKTDFSKLRSSQNCRLRSQFLNLQAATA